MDTKSITAVIIGLMVSGAILVAFVPIFTEVTATDEKFTNDGYYRMSEYDGSEEYTIEWVKTAPTTFTINGTPYNMLDVVGITNQYCSIIANDGAYLRVANAGNKIIIQSHNSVGNPLLALDTSNPGTLDHFNITLDAEHYTVSRTTIADDTVTVTASYSEWCYVFDEKGFYSMKKANESAYVVDEDIIILAGVTRADNTEIAVYGYGTVEGITLESVYPDDDTEYSNIEINSTIVNGFVDLNQITTVTFDMTRNESVTHATYSYFLVPYEVTAEKSVHGDDAFNAVINIIPLIAGVGLLMAGVYYFISRK